MVWPDNEAHCTSVSIDALPIAAAIVDRAGIVVAENAEFEHLCGRSSGTPINGVVAEAARTELEELLVGDEGKRSKLLRLSRNGGTQAIAEFSVVSAASLPTVVVFVTPQHFELDLELIDELASKAHDLHGHGVVIGDGIRVVHVSDAAAKIYGRSPEELVEMDRCSVCSRTTNSEESVSSSPSTATPADRSPTTSRRASSDRTGRWCRWRCG